MRSYLFFSALMLSVTAAESSSAAPYDLVIVGGRVMDPETGLDAPMNVGVRKGRIAAVTAKPISGRRRIEAAGLVVAPGFIDLHQHGHADEAYGLSVRDGVTTSLELEVGTADVAKWYRDRTGGQFVNYGVSVGHIPVRMAVMKDSGTFVPNGPAKANAATPAQIDAMTRQLERGLRDGAVAVGFGFAYTAAAQDPEYERMLRIARKYRASSHVHVEKGVTGLSRALRLAAATGAALHVAHANASGGAEIGSFLAQIDAARRAGQDVTTETYPYAAGMTRLESALFDDWANWTDERIASVQWLETGERLTRATFAQRRAEGGDVIVHSRTEALNRTAIGHPLTMIASDGIIDEGKGHPRAAGSYARVLGRYVREQKLLSPMDALRKMTIEPARRLAARVPAMARKGRVQRGADADLAIYDPAMIIDRATYEQPALPSLGIRYVIVNGIPVVEQGQLMSERRPGGPVRAGAR